VKRAERLTAGSDSLCVARGLAAPFMHKRYLYRFPVNYEKSEYILCSHRLEEIAGIQYEVVMKTPRLVLLRNLSFRAKGADTTRP